MGNRCSRFSFRAKHRQQQIKQQNSVNKQQQQPPPPPVVVDETVANSNHCNNDVACENTTVTAATSIASLNNPPQQSHVTADDSKNEPIISRRLSEPKTTGMKSFIQVAGHPGSFVTAGPSTILKKQVDGETSEAKVYSLLADDAVSTVIPKFYRQVEINNEVFIELEDLLQHFANPSIMDIKMGIRTFLESEVKNSDLRTDLYEKMVKVDSQAITAEERQRGAVTKLRYMQFREQASTSATLGFRIDAIRMSGQSVNSDLKQISTRQHVIDVMLRFTNSTLDVCKNIVQRLQEIRTRFESSKYFQKHEIIGSSLLILYDVEDSRVGVWMIDFAKTVFVQGSALTHRTPWQPGNHEDGYLTGLDNLIQLMHEIIGHLENQENDEQQISCNQKCVESNYVMSSSSSSSSAVFHLNAETVDLPCLL